MIDEATDHGITDLPPPDSDDEPVGRVANVPDAEIVCGRDPRPTIITLTSKQATRLRALAGWLEDRGSDSAWRETVNAVIDAGLDEMEQATKDTDEGDRDVWFP